MDFAPRPMQLAAALALLGPQVAGAQEPPTVDTARAGVLVLDTLVARALATSPAVRAASARLDAARARIGPAGARPDPTLVLGLQNVPVDRPGAGDVTTTRTVGVSQTLLYPGKLALRTRAAERELEAATARLEEARLAVRRATQDAYFDLVFNDAAFGVAARGQGALAGVIAAADAQYAAGSGGQSDVLLARADAARVAAEATAFAEGRRAAIARLNAARGEPSDAALAGRPEMPERVRRAALGDTAGRFGFVSSALGARAAGSPLPPLDSLQALAVRQNRALRALDAAAAAQAARVELARKGSLPDVEVALRYGQRVGHADVVSTTLSVPLPVQRGRKQHELVAEGRAELAALEDEHRAESARIRAEVAGLHGMLERDRTQLVLYTRAILPQARAALASTSASYRSGRGGGAAPVVEQQAALRDLETQYLRLLTDFGKTLATLEQLTGGEVLR